MTRKSKLVLRTTHSTDVFEIVKAVNTLRYGVPGDTLTRKEVEILLKDSAEMRRGDLVVEFIKGGN